MRRIIVVMFCAAFLTMGPVWAQEVNIAADDAAAMADLLENMENFENEALNDEGYGTDDEEYYGAENEMGNIEENPDEMPISDEEPMPVNAEESVADNNAVGE